MLTMLLPGTSFIYNGEELGMIDLNDTELPKECLVDVQENSRDYERNPMQWTADDANFGFSDCTDINIGNLMINNKFPAIASH